MARIPAETAKGVPVVTDNENKTMPRRAWIAHRSVYRPGHCAECAGSRTYLCPEAVQLGRAMRAEMIAGDNNGYPSESLPGWLEALLGARDD